MVTVNLSLQQSRRIPYVGVSAISQVPTKLLATRSQQQQQQQRPTTTSTTTDYHSTFDIRRGQTHQQ